MQEREHLAQELSQRRLHKGQKPRWALWDGERKAGRVGGRGQSSLDAENRRSEGPGCFAPVGGDGEQQKQEE